MTSFEEPIRILSDLHLGHPGSKVRAAAELRPLLDGAKTILFNGDTYELRKLKLRAIADAWRADIEALCDELGARPIYLTGNHDPEITEHHHLDLAGGRVFLTHGDILYDDISPWSKLIDSIHEQREIVRAEYPADYLDHLDLRLKAAKQIAARAGTRQVSGKPGLLGTIKTLLAESWPPRRPLKIIDTWMHAHQHAHALRDQFRPDADFIIFGHTHHAKVHESGGKHAINTGSFLPLSKSYVVELDGGKMRVVDGVQRGGEYRLGREVASFAL